MDVQQGLTTVAHTRTGRLKGKDRLRQILPLQAALKDQRAQPSLGQVDPGSQHTESMLQYRFS